MRRWSAFAVNTTAYTRPGLRRLRHQLFRLPTFYTFSAATWQGEQRKKDTRPPRGYAVFQRVDKPKDDVHAWIALLDGALPPHLRDWTQPSDNLSVLSATDVAEIILAAQYPQDTAAAHDLLFDLGFKHGRWNAVVWLIKGLVEKFPARHRHINSDQAVAVWQRVSSLEEFSRGPKNAVLKDVPATVQSVAYQTLDELTGKLPKDERRLLSLGHDALGQVWRTLGEMTKACAGGEIRPEVLEIIAYLHHKEVMPMSIYQNEPHPDGSAIQQPPLLSILSSRILTSLSDAAWRAHEKLVTEEARARGAEYAGLRPEVPGSVYRVNVAGLQPELWMELILWSCIHGGWTLQGIEILRSIAGDKQWKPLSWREYEKTIPQTGQTNTPEWLQWEHAYKTRPISRMDAPRRPIMNVGRTVSAEVVNAYIDAVASHVELDLGPRGIPIHALLQVLFELRAFLRLPNSFLDLSFSSWDALVTRLLESQTIIPEQNVSETQQLHNLSAGFGSGVFATNTKDQPVYVRDGNLAMQGLLHRVLSGQIAAGSLEGALSVYRHIQSRADVDKQKSLEMFMRRNVMTKLIDNDVFTSNYSGIDYPAFRIKLPTTILGSLLELVTDEKEFAFGRWLLYNDEMDGPIIGEVLYKDPFIQPAVIRFAAASNDQTLLAKFRQQGLMRDSFRAVFDTQVNSSRLDIATRVLEHLADTKGRKWSIENLTTVARLMLVKNPRNASQQPVISADFDTACSLFQDMCLGKYDGGYSPVERKQIQVQNVLSVLSAVDSSWARFCSKVQVAVGHHPFLMKARHFNTILDGIVTAYGSAAGKRVLEVFWPHTVRNPIEASFRLNRDRTGKRSTSRPQSTGQRDIVRQRISVKLPEGLGKLNELVMYGTLVPNTNTVMIILRGALAELKAKRGIGSSAENDYEASSWDAGHVNRDDDTFENSTRAIVSWAIRRLAELPYVDGSIVAKLDNALSEFDMEDIRDQLHEIMKHVEVDLSMDAEETKQWMVDDAHGQIVSTSLPESSRVG